MKDEESLCDFSAQPGYMGEQFAQQTTSHQRIAVEGGIN